MVSCSDRTGIDIRKARDRGDLVHREKIMLIHTTNVDIYKSERRLAPENGPVGTLVLDFQPPEKRENKFPLS